MIRFIKIFVLALLLPVIANAQETQFRGKPALEIIEKGVIISEYYFEEVNPFLGDFSKRLIVVYNSDLYRCDVAQKDLLISASCFFMYLKK